VAPRRRGREIAYRVTPAARGRRIAARAVTAVSAWAFAVLGQFLGSA
jgi:RimJ/RimL family protein N-acetyltransferase